MFQITNKLTALVNEIVVFISVTFDSQLEENFIYEWMLPLGACVFLFCFFGSCISFIFCKHELRFWRNTWVYILNGATTNIILSVFSCKTGDCKMQTIFSSKTELHHASSNIETLNILNHFKIRKWSLSILPML